MRSFPLDLELTTEGGLTMSLPGPADADQVFEACRDPEIQRFTTVPSPYTRDDAVAFQHVSEEAAQAGTAVNLLVRDGDRVLASAGLPRVSPDDGAAEVGYWVAPWARGRGVATAASLAVCRWAFDVVGFERLGLEAASVNEGSNAVARRLGFTLEGTLRQAVRDRAPDADGARFDMNVYGCLPGELAP